MVGKGVKRLLSAVILVGLASSSAALAAESPTALAGVKVVTAAEVQKLVAGGVPVYDVRAADIYGEGHIKGAINLPYREKSDKVPEFDAGKDDFALSKLPADKAAGIILYCDGVSCWKSYKAASVAVKAGYSNLNWYREGWPDWKAKGLPID